jgi:dTDP-4-amino-4,6-dideoxygalactose transaminase
MSVGAVARFRAALMQQLGPGVSVSLFWKGRVALHAILRALGVGPGDEVVLPGFTCVVVPNAVLYTGARPVYADIDATTYTLDVASIERCLSPRTRVILAQNTFGLPPDLDPLLSLARARGIRVVEDCAHGFGARYRGRPAGTTVDAAFFSGQWSKPICTGLGGIAVTRDPALAARLQELEATALAPGRAERRMLHALWWARHFLLTPERYVRAQALYRALGRSRLVVGSSRADELVAPIEPRDFHKRLSPEQAARGVDELAALPRRLDHRTRIAACWRTALRARGFAIADPPAWATHGWLRLPIEVTDKPALLDRAAAHRLELGDWFVSPLHPVTHNLSAWGYRAGSCPVAEAACRRIVNLPTHERIDEAYVERAVVTLKLQPSRRE